MPNHSLSLPSWEGFLISSMEVAGKRPHLRLVTDPAHLLVCSHCGAHASVIHETIWRTVRDLPMAEGAAEKRSGHSLSGLALIAAGASRWWRWI